MRDVEDILELIEDCDEIRFYNKYEYNTPSTHYEYTKGLRHIESPLGGFEFAQEAVEDLIDKINTIT